MARPRLHDPGYLRFLSEKPCCICGKPGQTQAAHIRIGFRAMQKKPDDRLATPLCVECHLAQHAMNETEFWRLRRLDPFEIAAKFYAEYGGSGGQPKRKRTKTNPRKPKEQRAKINGRSSWPKRRFQAR